VRPRSEYWSRPENSGRVQHLILFAFALFTFWENFTLGIRILDFVGLMILLSLAVLGKISLKVLDRDDIIALLFVTLNLLYVVVGVIRGYEISYYDASDIKAALGFGLGIVTFFICRRVSLTPKKLLRAINVLMLAHSLCLVLQFALYYLGDGFVLNLNPFFDTENLRILDGGFLRPSGFFAEPASHSLTLTLLFSLKSRITTTSRLDVIDWLGIITMLISGSIWGVVAAVVWIVYQKPMRAAVIVLLAFAVLNSSYIFDLLSQSPLIDQVFLQRITLLRLRTIMPFSFK